MRIAIERDSTNPAGGAAPLAAAARLLGCPVEAVAQVAGGRNSRVWKIRAGDRFVALKQYPVASRDPRDRLGTEVDALALLRRAGLDVVPQPLGHDADGRIGLFEWLDGAPVGMVGDSDIDQAVDFLARLHALAALASWPAGRLASEACLSGAEIERQIRARRERLQRPAEDDDALRAFLARVFDPTFARVLEGANCAARGAGLDFAAALPVDRRSLVPADFGFHNALRRPDGRLAFVDFEYFGWDDPAKLVADVLLHPAIALSAAQRRRFRSSAEAVYCPDPGFRARLSVHLPLFALRWGLILLNEFLPERWRQRQEAGEQADWPSAKARQLQKAARLIGGLDALPEDG